MNRLSPIAIAEDLMVIESTAFDLVERSRRGDRDAFTQLFEKYKQRLALLIYYKLPARGRAAETVEEILEKTFDTSFAYFPYSQLYESGSCLTWLSRVADHIVVATARRQNRQKRRGVSLDSPSGDSSRDNTDADGLRAGRLLMERAELEEWTDKLDALPETDRQLVLMARIEGLSTGEIAERLNQPHDTVADLLHQAIQCFRGYRNEPL